MARGFPVPRARRCARAFRRGHRHARVAAAAGVGRPFRELHSRARDPCSRDRPDAASRASGWMGRRHTQLRARREGNRHAQGLEPGRERGRGPDPMAGGRVGGPDRIDRGRPRGRRGCLIVRAGEPDGPPVPSRHQGARFRHALQRPLAEQASPSLVDVPDVLRLREARHPALGLDGAARDSPLHPRLDRPRRGRPDASAGRAPRRTASDPRARRDPPRRRERGRGGLVGRHRSLPSARCARAAAPGRADHRPLALCLSGGAAARRVCAGGPGERGSGRDPDRHRQRGRLGDRGAREADRRGRPLPGGEPAVLGALRSPGPVLPGRSAPARHPGPRLHRGGIYPGVGEVRGHGGRIRRDAHLRILRTAEGRTEQVRVHPGQGRRDSQGGTRKMKPTQQLHELGQSLWLDNITRTMLDDGTEQGYIDDYDVTGQTSNPTIFDKAIGSGDAYDEQIAELREKGVEGEELFFELALADVTRAARMFEQIHKEPDRMDGWVSLEVSPTLAYDTQASIQQAADLHSRAEENNFIKIPGTPEGLPAIEESIFAGVPINVTLLMSSEQTLAAADAYMKGIERRIEADLDPDVPSVLSIFISRWDVAVHDQVPDELKNTLGIAVGKATYRDWWRLFESDRWNRLAEKGARLQRLLFASTGTKDPQASDTLYIEAFAAPDTINTMPDKTLKAFADHGKVGDSLPEDGGDAEDVFKAHQEAGVDTDALGLKLQQDGAEAFVKSWNELLGTIKSESERLAA